MGTSFEAKSESIEQVAVKVKKLPHFKGELPIYQTRHASGFDIRAQLNENVNIRPGHRLLIPTGLIFEVPLGFELQARPRSGWAIKNGISLVNSPGTIDADYRGEVKIILINHGQDSIMVCDQDRIAQFVLCPVVQAQLIEVDEVGTTARGSGGFGSTGHQSSRNN